MIAGALAAAARLVAGASIRWTGCAPDPRQRIYFVNHTSHLDFIVVWSSLPSKLRPLVRPVAARDYWTTGRLRPYLATEVFHSVLIEREAVTASNDPIRTMLEGMGQSYSLIMFPEGTRGSGLDVAPFKSGLYHLAHRRPDVELVPVYVENLNRILPKGEFLPVPLLSSVTFGAPIRLETGERRDAFLERAREGVRCLRPL